jgi:hypothetical protein
MVERKFAQEMPLVMGTYLHEFIAKALRGTPHMAEVKLDPWLPEGWGGTADALVWDEDERAFALRDYKSMRGEGFGYLNRGPKEEHLWQTSMYYHGARAMGLPMLPDVGVLYLPKNDTPQHPEPTLLLFEPLPEEQVVAEANRRRARVDEYLDALPEVMPPGDKSKFWLTDELEPVQERVQKLTFDKKTETWDLKLAPHWSAAYCPFPDELCDCNLQGQTKIGMFDVDGETYVPRSGYEEIEPEVFPT